MSLPEDVRGRTLQGLISRWARNDSNAVGEWINHLTGAVRDEAITAFSTTVGSRDPAAALTWAMTVAEPAVRNATVERVVMSWSRRSPGDARAWIQNSALPDPEKSRLLSLPVR